MTCQHLRLYRSDLNNDWYCWEPTCNFRWRPPPSDVVDISDDGLRALWLKHGGKFFGPNVETGSMPEAQLLSLLRSLCIDRNELLKARELLEGHPRFAVLKGCQRGDLVFLTPAQALMEKDVTYMRQEFDTLTKGTGVKIVILPPGFVVNAKDAGDDTPRPFPGQIAEATPKPDPMQQRTRRAFDPSGQDGWGEDR